VKCEREPRLALVPRMKKVILLCCGAGCFFPQNIVDVLEGLFEHVFLVALPVSARIASR
jgi:hypothetical protein